MNASDKYGEYFEARAPSQAGSRVLAFWHRRMFDVAARTVPAMGQRGKLLEIGAGHGFFGEICRARGVEYEGLEMNAGQAERLREKGLVVTTATVPPLPAGEPVDCIWISHVLEHARDHAEAREMLACTRARTKPGGHVVITSPDLRSWRSEFWGADWSHGYPTTLRRVCQLVNEVGMEVVKARTLVATMANPLGVALAGVAAEFIPYRVIDAISLRLGGRDLAYSFMGTFGWKQVNVIGKWR